MWVLIESNLTIGPGIFYSARLTLTDYCRSQNARDERNTKFVVTIFHSRLQLSICIQSHLHKPADDTRSLASVVDDIDDSADHSDSSVCAVTRGLSCNHYLGFEILQS